MSDNKFDCPPRMSDGRHYTDYSPRCVTNFFALPKPLSSHDYRMYLTNNAEKLMEQNRASATKLNSCNKQCTNTTLPEQTHQVCDGRTCSFPLNEPSGLGLGRPQKSSFGPNDEMSSVGTLI